MSFLTILIILVGVVILALLGFWWFRRAPGTPLTDDERALLKAKTFDRYTLRCVRKRAVLSTMYQAVDRETKATVALRILRPDLAMDPDQVRAFKRRGEIIEYLNKEHPDLSFVRLLKYGQFRVGQNSRPFIAVEFFKGRDLGELLQEKKALPVADVVAIITQVAKTLSVVLREKVWHHQLALQAIMVREGKDGGPEAKVVDFDLSRQEQGAASAGAAQGRFIFMSPEQFENKIVDDRSDIYSLGALFYLLLTGRPPFAGSDYAEVARLQKTTSVPSLSEGIPASVGTIVTKMLQKQPSDRYQSMDDVAGACQALQVEASWHAVPDTTGIRPIAAPVVPEETTTAEPKAKATERHPTPRTRGGAGNVIREVLAMILSPFTKVFSKLTPAKIGIAVAILVIAGIAYLLFRSNAVNGEINIQVASSKGAPLSGAAVVLEPATGGGGEPSVKFTDVVTDASMKGKLEAKTSSNGTLKLKYAVTPGTRFGVRISAPDYLDRQDSLVITGDTSFSLAYTLAPKPVAVPMSVFVHDKAKNPIGSVNIRIRVKSGKEYTLTSDARGMASLEYDPTVEGNSPEVSLSAPSLGSEYGQSAPRQQTLSGRQLRIDINDYFPYDETLDRCLREAEGSIRKKDWKEARAPLLKAVQIRPGQGSAKAYALLAEAWWEDDSDNYKESGEAARKAIADERNLTGRDKDAITEMMHYIEVRSLHKAWQENKTSTNKQDARSVSQRYLSMMKTPRFAAMVRKNDTIKDHLGKVRDIYDDVK